MLPRELDELPLSVDLALDRQNNGDVLHEFFFDLTFEVGLRALELPPCFGSEPSTALHPGSALSSTCGARQIFDLDEFAHLYSCLVQQNHWRSMPPEVDFEEVPEVENAAIAAKKSEKLPLPVENLAFCRAPGPYCHDDDGV